eukprot:COSAG02_NODE_13407_length_1398_cov_1.491917_1_plen_75_part_00
MATPGAGRRRSVSLPTVMSEEFEVPPAVAQVLHDIVAQIGSVMLRDAIIRRDCASNNRRAGADRCSAHDTSSGK